MKEGRLRRSPGLVTPVFHPLTPGLVKLRLITNVGYMSIKKNNNSRLEIKPAVTVCVIPFNIQRLVHNGALFQQYNNKTH